MTWPAWSFGSHDDFLDEEPTPAYITDIHSDDMADRREDTERYWLHNEGTHPIDRKDVA